MLQEKPLSKPDVLTPISQDIYKRRSDLFVLGYMAHSLHLTLQTVEQQIRDTAQPLLYYAEERHQRIHRIAIYKQQMLRQNAHLSFVGFVSRKKQPLATAIVDAIYEVDRKLVAELLHAPGLLSYSSLELHTGTWYNLVVLDNTTAKQHIKNSKTHQYAAFELSQHYYQWIRLHSGFITDGLDQGHLVLQKTKHYIFRKIPSQSTMHETTDNASLSLAQRTSKTISLVGPVPFEV
jgi:hypothetical protein